MNMFDRYFSQSSAPRAAPPPSAGRDLTLDDWKAILARAEAGEAIRLRCDAVGGEFAVGPKPDAVKDVPCFTSVEIRAMCARGYTVAEARAIYAVKKEFPGSKLEGV